MMIHGLKYEILPCGPKPYQSRWKLKKRKPDPGFIPKIRRLGDDPAIYV
jgi:hypothetical protein